jgi:hypothetical protein
VKEKRFQLFETKGEFWNRLERALDLSKNVSEPAKNDLGNSPSRFDTIIHHYSPTLRKTNCSKWITWINLLKDLKKAPENNGNG